MKMLASALYILVISSMVSSGALACGSGSYPLTCNNGHGTCNNTCCDNGIESSTCCSDNPVTNSYDCSSNNSPDAEKIKK